MCTFAGTYLGYMGAVMLIRRMMDLDHYFIPLSLGWILFAAVLKRISRFGRFRIGSLEKTLFLGML